MKTATADTFYGPSCKAHYPIIPTVQGLKKEELAALCKKHNLAHTEDASRVELSQSVVAARKQVPIRAVTTVDLSRALAVAYERFGHVDIVLVENQMAARMAVVQGMVTHHWVLKGVPKIEIVSPANKLKGLAPKKTTYAERKKLSVEHTRRLLTELGINPHVFETHKKKDDLADTFLQAMWFIRKDL